MRDWERFLDKFLSDTELPILSGPGTVAHDEAIAWAEGQYESFAGRRRLEAEAAAEARYLDDLRASAQTLDTERKKLSAPRSSKKRKSGK
jgi:hypothetical protein